MGTTAKVQIVSCPECGTKNRVDPARQAVCGKCKTPLVAVVAPFIVTDQNFGEEVEKSSLPVLVDFWAAWCGPCRMVAPVVEQLAKELRERCVSANLMWMQIRQQPGASGQSIPSLLIFKNGKEVDRIVGVQSKDFILRRLNSYL